MVELAFFSSNISCADSPADSSSLERRLKREVGGTREKRALRDGNRNKDSTAPCLKEQCIKQVEERQTLTGRASFGTLTCVLTV